MLIKFLEDLIYYFPQFLFLNLLFILLYIFSEVIYIYKLKDKNIHFIWTELLRKSVHLLTSIIFIIGTFLLPELIFIFLCFESLLAFIISKKINTFSAAHKTREIDKNHGLYMYIIGVILAVTFFYNHIDLVRVAFLILGFSDSIASLIGKLFPYKKFKVFNYKSLSGSTAFFISTLIILYFSQTYSEGLIQIFMLSIGITLLEIISYKGNDNLLILIGFPLLYFIGTRYNIFFNVLLLISILLIGKYSTNIQNKV